MNSRERFLKCMHFEKVDRPPFQQWMGFWPDTIKRWYKEGLPIGMDIDDFFGFDRRAGHRGREGIAIDFGPIPRYISEIKEETSRYRIWTGGDGVTRKEFVDGYSMPQWIDFPIKSRKDWQKMKERLKAKDPRRYPLTWSEELIEKLNNRDYPLGILCGSFFGWARNHIGLENILYLFYDDPGLIHDINNFYEEFIIGVLEEVVSKVKFDYAAFWEDMAYKNGPLISPKLFREFMLPHYKRITSFLRNHGIDIFLVDSDGNTELLIPSWLEGGVTVHWPLEVAAGMDAVALRKKYAHDLGFIGNIDKRALIQGKEAIKKEIFSKVPYLIKEGGYIPEVDHCVPSDVSLENFLYYLRLLREIFGMDKGKDKG